MQWFDAMQLRQQHITAIVIVSALALWQASGLLTSAPVPEESSAADNLTAVRVGVFDQENFTATLSIRGRTEAIRKVADAYNRTRLTPLVAKLFRWWFAWRR